MSRFVFLILFVATAHAADPFIIFGPWQDPSLFPIVEKYLHPSDFITAQLAQRDPKLAQRFSREHLVVFAASLPEVHSWMKRGCGAGTPKHIIYQLDHTGRTPANEEANPPRSVAEATSTIRGDGCHEAGTVPAGQYFGIQTASCTSDPAASIYRQVDWTGIQFVDIQGEWLLSDQCVGRSGIDDYVKFTSTVAAYVRSRNPRITVAAHSSLRFTPPATIVRAIQAMSGVVDGIVLSYPLNPATERKYCTPDNLIAVLSALRTANAN